MYHVDFFQDKAESEKKRNVLQCAALHTGEGRHSVLQSVLFWLLGISIPIKFHLANLTTLKSNSV